MLSIYCRRTAQALMVWSKDMIDAFNRHHQIQIAVVMEKQDGTKGIGADAHRLGMSGLLLTMLP